MNKLRLSESDDAEPGEVNEPSGIVGAIGAFLSRHGIATLFACVLLYSWLYKDQEDRKLMMDQIRAQSSQIERLASAITQLTAGYSDHITDSKENNRLQMAQCLNQSESAEERERCLGFR